MKRLPALAALTGVALLAGATFSFDRWIAATEIPDLTRAASVTAVDRTGRLLAAYTVDDGRWRLPVTGSQVDPRYLAMLVALEDRRFWSHPGVDPVALVRAAWQAARTGRIVSGGSTLTMQVARLVEEGPTGDWRGKLRQMRLALALERRLDKAAVLDLYLALAPYGGNLEGVRAASLAWFGREPARLTPAEAALLVALPQAPEARRPDRNPQAARIARDRTLIRAAAAGVLEPTEAAAARRDPVPDARRPFPSLAPHLVDRLVAQDPAAPIHRLTLDAGLQSRLETLVRARARELGPGLSAAVIVADIRSGEVLARVGAADRFDASRRGFVDMSHAVRSPGSTLKPLIYGLAFEAGLAHPETVIEDRPMRFGGYAPQNLDRQWGGAMTLRTALQRSRNLPAVALLDAVGPAQLMARLKRAGARPHLPPGGAPGLAIALGGVGVTLEDLVAVYAAIARGGEAVTLRERIGAPAAPPGGRVLGAAAAWQVGDVLYGAPPPPDAPSGQFAFKTGTSYGHRDAWAIGFDGAYVVGVWFGRPDGAAAPGVLGLETAAPTLFAAFARLEAAPSPPPPPPPGVLTVGRSELPPPLRRFRPRGATDGERGPRIAFPPEGARVDLGLAAGAPAPLALRVDDGVPPFRWLVDGVPLDDGADGRQAEWLPRGPGFVDLAVIDATGAAARAHVFLQ